MARPDERRFVTYPRGYIRDKIILANFRIELREAINPDTGVLFTEDEIARITQEGSRYWIEADAVDLLEQANQARALHLADQVDPRRAHSDFLRDVHGPLWVGDKLPATGGSGTVTARASNGTIFAGSTTLGAPGFQVATDAAGNKYQVQFTATTPAPISPATLGSVQLTLRAIDAGRDTNPRVGDVLTWVNPPAGAEPECSVTGADFSGGFDAETDAEYAQRIADTMRFRPRAGNAAHFRLWAEQASVAVESAFVYACAFHAGSVLVSVLQRRGSSTGPLARVASSGTIADVTARVVPPNSPVVPKRAFVLVTGCTPQESDAAIELELEKGTSSGWADSDPWPRSTASAIASVTSQTEFTITAPTGDLPGGVSSLTGADAPRMMIWNKDTSRFEKLEIASVTETAGTYTIELSQAPAFVFGVGDFVSPYTDLHETLAETIEAYFDELGPGEVVDLDSDLRASRAHRFPRPGRQYPYRATAAIVSRIQDTLGNVIDGNVSYSRTEPDLPADISDGPNYLVLGKVRIAEL